LQKANCIVRLGGDLSNAVPKLGVTPAEILILRFIHGDDAVVDVRPTEFDKKVRMEQEVDRLARRYDAGSNFVSTPGEDRDRKSIIETLFPGAIKRLPLTLEEIGIDSGKAPRAGKAKAAPTPEPEAEEGEEVDATQSDGDETADTATVEDTGE
jgi:hypothetical protein